MRVRRSIARCVLILAAAAPEVRAAGGAVVPRTDGTPDGYYYSLGGSGSDRHISEYADGEIEPGAIVCGLRIGQWNRGQSAPDPMLGELRLEDPGNPGYPDLSASGLVATADSASLGPCTPSGNFRLMTFGGGAGVPSVIGAPQYACVVEPASGSSPFERCGVLLDTSGGDTMRAKYYSGGFFGPIPWNHFVELAATGFPRVDLRARASGSSRFPGDAGRPVVFTTRRNWLGQVTDDNVTVSMTVDNRTGSPISRSLRICADVSVIDPKRGQKELTSFFRPVGGGAAIMNPISFPSGRTILKLAISTALQKSVIANVVDQAPVNLPIHVFVDVPAIDADPCALDGAAFVDAEATLVGLRRRAGSPDDGRAEQHFTVQSGDAPGDSIQVRNGAHDMPHVSYSITGFEVVAREVGGAGLPGLDAIELRVEDPILVGSPDLSAAGLLRAVGEVDGVGSAPIGPGSPATVVFDVPDLVVDPTLNPALVEDFFLRAVFLPGRPSEFIAIGVDSSPLETQLGDSSAIEAGVLPALPIQGNAMLRLLVGGDRATFRGDGVAATEIDHPVVRTPFDYVKIDRSGRVIE